MTAITVRGFPSDPETEASMTAALELVEEAVPAAPGRPVPLTGGERVRAVAVLPLWLTSVAAWGAVSATMLTWSAVRELPRRRR